MMGARATLVGGEELEANRRCGRPTAGAVGAVEVGSCDDGARRRHRRALRNFWSRLRE